MTAETEVMVGQYTSDGTYKILQLPAEVHHFQIWNYTDHASSANPGIVKRAWWFLGMATDYYLGVKNTDGAATDESVLGTSGGFRWIESQPNNLEAADTGTAITNANPAVTTVNAHGYSIGDTILITGTTGMLQIAGMEFTVTAVGGANNFTIGYLDASGFAAAATALTTRRVTTPPMFAPRRRYITAITQAASAVVTLSVTHGYHVGEHITFHVPTDFGMSEIDGLTGEITAINTTTNTVTVNIDSTAFTAFAFPASAGVPFTHAHVVPMGDDATVLTGGIDNQGYRALRIGATVDGADGDEMKWIAFRAGYRLIEA